MEPSRRAAVLGRPVAHSLSPALHAAAYAALGLDWAYTAVDCGEEQLPGFVAGLGPEWAGLSLTMPLKRAALAVAASVDPLAAAVGAANTLLLPTRTAHNTDVHGIVAALREAMRPRPTAVGDPDRAPGAGGPPAAWPGSAVILGAGGTAQAALAALRELGVTDPVVLVRDAGRTTDLRAAADRLGVRPEVRAGLDAIPPADVVVSTLPAGAADALDPPGTVLLDVVYSPWPTPLAAAAARAGATVVSGLAMLLHQAAAQVELMTGHPAPIDAMRAAIPLG
jgi:shikimate dehydrogenase